MSPPPPLRETPASDHPIPLVDLYKIALDQYRFEVKLNADRMIQYLTLSVAILSAGVGLLRISHPDTSTKLFVGILFFCGALTSILGALAVKRGHEYYRRTACKKTLIEELLGLHHPLKGYGSATLAVVATRGQRQVREMLDDPERWVRKGASPGTITWLAYYVFSLVFCASLFGIALLLYPWLRQHI